MAASQDHDAARDLTRVQQLGWASGALGTGMMIGSVSGYALFIMTTLLGIGPATAGLLIGASKFYDVIIDPLIGRISDRSDSRWGRRRPFLLAGIFVAPPAFIALFAAPDLGALSGAYMFVTLLLIATGTSLFMVPYMTMAAEMTTRYNERTVLMSQRVLFNSLGLLAMTAVLPQLMARFDDRLDGYRVAGFAGAAIVALAFFSAFYLTRGTRFVTKTDDAAYTLADQLRYIVTNRSFAAFMAAKICTFLSQSSLQGTLLLYGRYILGRDERFLQPFGIGYTAGSLLALPFWTWLATRVIGKRTAYNISILGLGLVFMTWLLATPGEPTWIAYLRFFLVGVLSAGSMTAGTAMLPDIMELDRRTTGVRQEGLYAAAYTLVENVGSTIGPVFLGLALGATGFVAVKGGALVEQPEAALTAIKLCVSIVPAFFMAAAAFFMAGYRVDRDLRAAATEART